MMDEVFGEDNFLNAYAWINNLKGRQIGRYGAARTHETVLAYTKSVDRLTQPQQISVQMATAMMPDAYRMKSYDVLRDSYGPYVLKNELHNTNSKFNEETRADLVFNIHYSARSHEVRFTNAESVQEFPGFVRIPPKPNNDGVHRYHAWRWQKRKIEEEIHNLEFEDAGGTFRIYTKVRDFEATNLKDLVTNLRNAGSELSALEIEFPTPKPSDLVRILAQSVTDESSIVLDSFAGSGTTGHAVLALNNEDRGSRRFILVECEDYADTVTAERIRRVIEGVPEAKDVSLQNGLGGSFTYCTLGDPFDAESLLNGKSLPDYETLAVFLIHTAAGISLEADTMRTARNDQRFYQTETTDYYLYYEPDLEWLKSDEAMLTPERAKQIEERKRPATVFGAGKYLSQRELTGMEITFCQLPYELFKGG